MSRKAAPSLHNTPGGGPRVLTDYEDLEYPIAVHDADWWLTKTEVADLITALTKALQEAP